ncbi:MAG: hypothetical protein LBC67_01775 [Spirochaetales bacterium]|nr:hypothetical protein [Spirochaetales bacterium]
MRFLRAFRFYPLRRAPLKNAIRTTATQCWYDALSLIVRIAKIRVLSG